MLSVAHIFAALRYKLRDLPWYTWPLFLLFGFLEVWTARKINLWNISYIEFTHLDATGIFFSCLFGTLFLRRCGGFFRDEASEVVNYSISRRSAYLSGILFYFAVMLAIPVLAVYAASGRPDLRLEFDHHWGNESITTPQQESFYVTQFPESRPVLDQSNPLFRRAGYDSTLVIPSGKALIAEWNLLVTFMLAIIMQLTMFFRPYRGMNFLGTLVLLYLVIETTVRMAFHNLGPQPTLYEDAFFFFAHHGLLIVLPTLAVFLMVQWAGMERALRREPYLPR